MTSSPDPTYEEMDDLYREIILDHYRNPRNSAYLENADLRAEGNNPFCGDEVEIQVKMGNGRVQQVGLQGRGCVISQASASIMTELVRGRTLGEIESLYHRFRALMRGESLDDQQLEEMGPLEALQGVRKYPVRVKCALLGWSVLEEGIQSYQAKSQA